ncbi:cellulose binding domain-containing protein [Planobispora longispora]|uniref:CBM2 domain-containing protein n=1 Tax=Planobispora longispora TaxID=28887 RepID=A0A8J3W6H5_9ACTN|nr:cellulose binding domain-containing protein [Planobispora longispora]GIH77837.1 hypothetical protein Plo01_42660 [Planobispora longispora]
MPRGKTTTLLGAASLGAAVALIAAACVGGPASPPPAHPAAHGASPAAPPVPPADPASGSSQQSGSSGPSEQSASSQQSGSSGPPAAPSHSRPPSPAAGCTATLTLVESWPGGYRGTATISNRTGGPMRDWYIQWLLPRGATITQAWKGTHMQSGPIAMIHAPADDPVLAPGATVSEIGFIGAAPTPPSFTEITCG